jgi:hypothetical protein
MSDKELLEDLDRQIGVADRIAAERKESGGS